MNRAELGRWAVGASESDLAQALALLGLVAGNTEELPRWLEVLVKPPEPGSAIRPPLRPERIAQAIRQAASGPSVWPWSVTEDLLRLIQDAGVPKPQWLAMVWRDVAVHSKMRLEIAARERDAPFQTPANLPSVVELLSHRDVRVASVYVRDDEPKREVGWTWPLTIGALEDAESQNLVRRLQIQVGQPWMRPLVQFANTADPGAGCDLLLMPMTLRDALRAALTSVRPVRAECVVVLGSAGGTDWYRLVEALRATVHTSGVAVVRVGVRAWEHWFGSLVAHLSHNEPLDVALCHASADIKVVPPFLAASAALLEHSRLARQLRRLESRLVAPTVADKVVALSPDSQLVQQLNIEPGLHALGKLGQRLGDMIRKAEADPQSSWYHQEQNAATAGAELAAHAGSTEGAAAPAKPDDRYIQARVADTTDPTSPKRRQWSFRAGAIHDVTIRIGRPNAEWPISASMAFRVDALPPQDEYDLTVVIVGALLGEPQTAHITLPRAGDSSECVFHVLVPETLREFEARIVILHRNRVLQTALLRGTVSTDPDDKGGDGIWVESGGVIRAHLEDLAHRTQFAGALVLNHDSTGNAAITGIADDHVGRILVSQPLNDEIGRLDAFLTDIARDPKDYQGTLNSPATVDLLRKLAGHGSLLHDYIVKDFGLAKLGLDGNGPLQVTSAAPDARLPVEFIYDRDAPADSAPMCQNSEQALLNGQCKTQCPHSEQQHEVVCPLAFWGLKRVIERQRHDPGFARQLAGTDFEVAEPTSSRRALDPIRGAAIAGTQRIDKTVPNGMSQVCARWKVASVVPVTSWAGWEQEIKDKSPSLLLLIVHTEPVPDERGIPQAEIGTNSWLKLTQIGRRHVVGGSDFPIVLLLGCETGVSDREFGNFISRLRHAGAAIVVASGAKIHSLHAVPVAGEFLEAIYEAVTRSEATFGEVMREVRCRMLGKGLPMVLALTAYGDADWKLVHA